MTDPVHRKFYEFIEILKDAGVRISTDEVLYMFTALPNIPVDNRDVFRQTLRTTLIKDYTDIPVFDKCFAEYFENQARVTLLNEDALSALKESHNVSGDEIREIDSLLDTFIDSLEESTLEKTAEDLLAIFLDELEESNSSGGGAGGLLFQKGPAILQSYSGRTAEAAEAEEGETDELLNLMMEMLKGKMGRRKIGREIQSREEYLLNKFIYQLTADEVREMKELVKRFGQKLKTRISLRKKKMKHGHIDIKKTMRTSLQYGGIPFRIFNKDRKIDRPQLVVMCDVSGSVNQYTRFMLLLTYTLQSLFSKVRTFAFISNMVEITDLFMEMDPERAINSIFHDTNFTYGWGTNYGRCLDMFAQDYSDSLNSKTTVLILGDARNNNQDPGLNSFIKIKERSRSIFWLNPEKKHLWDWSDSIAGMYRPHCIEMKEVNNFLDLSEFIDKLFIDV